MTQKKFIVLYEKNVDAVFRFCLIKVSDREKAKDLAQEAFMRVWDQVSSGKKIENPRAFLFKVARNLIIDSYRKKKSLSLDELSEGGFDPVDSTFSAEKTTDMQIAIDLIQKLDEGYKEILTLRFVEGLEPREIAEILDMSPNVVSVRIHRGIDQLKKLMKI
jgi:RNA polymerase sigma-70 factor (ECF subfamily)